MGRAGSVSEQGGQAVSWTDAPADVVDAALKHCRGAYQRNIVLGVEALSGSTLKGRAATYHGRYMESQSRLLARLKSAGILVAERRERPNRRILVLRWPSMLSLAGYYGDV